MVPSILGEFINPTLLQTCTLLLTVNTEGFIYLNLLKVTDSTNLPYGRKHMVLNNSDTRNELRVWYQLKSSMFENSLNPTLVLHPTKSRLSTSIRQNFALKPLVKIDGDNLGS